MKRLLVITAHPDDEAGGFGGALKLYHLRGVETYVICLTPGQAASNRGGAKDDAELSAMRRKEFEASCKLLEITRGEILDYRDGKLDQEDFHAVVTDLTQRVRQLRPQVMLTFGTEGAITAHPDHTMAALFTTAAFHWAGRSNRFPQQLQNGLRPYQPQKLYHTTANFTMPEREPVSLAPWTCALDIGEHLETKIAAFKRHSSQSPLFERFEVAMRKRGARELLHLAATSTPREIQAETDLFAGIVED
jgi:LmbE family N-acetylglucosaminyl deacetylase